MKASWTIWTVTVTYLQPILPSCVQIKYFFKKTLFDKPATSVVLLESSPRLKISHEIIFCFLCLVLHLNEKKKLALNSVSATEGEEGLII